MNSYPNLVSDIQRRNCPVVFMDTCSILDVLRITVRGKHKINEIIHAHSLIKSESLSFVISDVVHKEIYDHLEEVVSETENIMIDVDEKIERALKTLEVFGKKLIPNINLKSEGIPALLKSLIEELVEKSYLVDTSEASKMSALNRQISLTRPSKKGKDCIKDCMIFEQYLECGKNSTGINGKKYFITSNSIDFGQAGDLNNIIDQELNNFGIKHVSNFSWLFAEIKGGDLVVRSMKS